MKDLSREIRIGIVILAGFVILIFGLRFLKGIEIFSNGTDYYVVYDNLDGLNYLVGKTLDYVNKKAMEATIAAHVDGDVPNILITMEKLDEENLGQLIYFFELACAMSGRLLEVNPFNQPGVEKYKKNMFRLLE